MVTRREVGHPVAQGIVDGDPEVRPQGARHGGELTRLLGQLQRFGDPGARKIGCELNRLSEGRHSRHVQVEAHEVVGEHQPGLAVGILQRRILHDLGQLVAGLDPIALRSRRHHLGKDGRRIPAADPLGG